MNLRLAEFSRCGWNHRHPIWFPRVINYGSHTSRKHGENRYRSVCCPSPWVVQGEFLSLGTETKKTTPSSKSGQPGDSGQQGADKDRDMGGALRSVYQKAVDEKIPDEMLDLLSKLD